MPAESNDRETSGFFGALIESVRAHVDERLKSPFAGAFAIAWAATNWKLVLILLFSSSSIEDRIKIITDEHLGLSRLVFFPVGIAILLAIGYYVCSAFFVVILELYGMGRRKIERSFDGIRWVSPSTYINFKQKSRDEIKRLTDFATDNLAAVEAEKTKVADLSVKNLALQEELHQRSTDVQARTEELAQARHSLASASAKAEQEAASRLSLSKDFSELKNAAAKVGKVVTTLLPPESLQEIPRPMSSDETQEVRRAILIVQEYLTPSIDETEDEELSSTSLRHYTHRQFPLLGVNESLQTKLLRDLQSANVSLPTLGMLNRIVDLTRTAVSAYSRQRPDLFTTGTDFLTKSLGFYFPAFRAKHGFSDETLHAFEVFGKLVSRVVG
jgi:hypothetical protein